MARPSLPVTRANAATWWPGGDTAAVRRWEMGPGFPGGWRPSSEAEEPVYLRLWAFGVSEVSDRSGEREYPAPTHLRSQALGHYALE